MLSTFGLNPWNLKDYDKTPWSDKGRPWFRKRQLGTWTLVIVAHLCAIYGLVYAGWEWWAVGIPFAYIFSIIGTYIGAHRYFVHNSFELNDFWHHTVGLITCLTVSNSLIEWIGMHRMHHKYSDKRGDVHSPYINGYWGNGVRLYPADHRKNGPTLKLEEKYIADIRDDKFLLFADNNYYKILAVYLGLLYYIDPLAIIFFWALPVIWYWWGLSLGVGSILHWPHKGSYRNFDIPDYSTNVPWAYPLVGGEVYHNNHHAYPQAADLGMAPGEWDFTWWFAKTFLRAKNPIKRGYYYKGSPDQNGEHPDMIQYEPQYSKLKELDKNIKQ